MFDEIEALADDEPVSLILTTNGIDRIESAVKDRPGRVGQCVYFGPPSAALRRRRVQSYLQQHATSAVDLSALAEMRAFDSKSTRAITGFRVDQ